MTYHEAFCLAKLAGTHHLIIGRVACLSDDPRLPLGGLLGVRGQVRLDIGVRVSPIDCALQR